MPESQSIVEILLKISASKEQLAQLQTELNALKAQAAASLTPLAEGADPIKAAIASVGAAVAGTTGSVQASKTAIASHEDILTVWSSQLGKTGDSFIGFGERTQRLSTLSDSFSQKLLEAALASKGVEGSITDLARAAEGASLGGLPRFTFAQQASNKEAEAAARLAEAGAQSTNRFAQATTAAASAASRTPPILRVSKSELDALAKATKDSEINFSSLARGIDLMASGAIRGIPGMSGLAGEIRAVGQGAIGTATQIGLLSTILIGTGIGAAVAFAAALASIVTKGVEVTKSLQDLGAGVQGTLKSNTDFTGPQIKSAGPQSIISVTEAANAALVPITELSKAFDAVFPSASRANTTIDGLSNVIAKLISEEDHLHIPATKIVTDLQSIFNGSVTNTNQLAQQLGITKEMAAAWREAGTTTDELTAKTKAFAEASDTGTTSIARGQQMVVSSFEQLAAAAVKPIVEPLTHALIDLSATMNTVDASNVVTQFERIIEVIGRVIVWCQSVGRAIVNALNAASQFVNSSVISLMNPADKNAADVDRLTGQENLAAKSRQEAQQRQFEIEVGKIRVEETDTRPPIGAGGGRGGGGGGKKAPSADTLDQQEISKIQSEINAKEAEYNALVEKNKVDHELGLTTLGKENSLNLKGTQDYINGIDQGISKLEQMKAKVQAVADAQGGTNDKEQTQLNKLDQTIAKLELLKSKAQLAAAGDTFWGQWTISMNAFRDSLALTGAKAAQVFQSIANTGIDGVSNALTGLVSGTKDWSQAFVQAGEQIINTLIKVALQAVVGVALQQTSGAASRFDSARTAAAGVFASASTIPAIGWIIAPIAAAAAFAAVLAFAEGGIVPGSPSNKDNMIAHVASGEGIVTARAVQYYGPQVIHAMNAMTAPSFAEGGIVGQFGSQGGGGTKSRPLSVNVFSNQSDMVQHVLGHPDAEHKIVDIMRRNRFQLKV